jgi:hypothetical protein
MTEPSTQPDFHGAFARIAVDYWRLLRAYDRLRGSIASQDSPRLAAQSRFAAERLENVLGQVGLRMVLFDGQAFHPGLPVEALNVGDFDSEEGLVVAFTTEPTVLAEGRVIALGKVTLERVQQGAS